MLFLATADSDGQLPCIDIAVPDARIRQEARSLAGSGLQIIG